MRVSQSKSGKVWLDGSRVEKYGQVLIIEKILFLKSWFLLLVETFL